ncbi:Transposable element protein [Forsythia ovata]|uniref:Transposable element protein n=1 Tax=Forsythia ovata TaxID=205694 RepID=A0ABD1WB13_9LAMI
MTLNQVFNSFRVEEQQHRKVLSQGDGMKAKANLVENSKNSFNTSKQFKSQNIRFKKNFHRNKKNFQPKNNYTRDDKGKGKGESKLCFVCERADHVAQDCYFRKTKEYKPKSKSRKDQVNMLEDGEPSIRCYKN